MKSEPFSVGLVNLGDDLPIDLRKLSIILNKHQNAFVFKFVRTISTEKIGDPAKEKWYDNNYLLTVLANEDFQNKYNYIVGITKCSITDMSEVDLESKDYFSKSDLNKNSIVSISPQILLYKDPNKDIYQYVAFLAVAELLNNLKKCDICHSAAKSCLFDECEDRMNIRACMEKGEICSKCLSSLEVAIDPDIIIEVEKVLRWCKKVRWLVAAKAAFKHPIFTLFSGMVVGSLFEKYFSIDIPYGLLKIAIFMAVLFLIILLSKRMYKSKKNPLNETD